MRRTGAWNWADIHKSTVLLQVLSRTEDRSNKWERTAMLKMGIGKKLPRLQLVMLGNILWIFVRIHKTEGLLQKLSLWTLLWRVLWTNSLNTSEKHGENHVDSIPCGSVLLQTPKHSYGGETARSGLDPVASPTTFTPVRCHAVPHCV